MSAACRRTPLMLLWKHMRCPILKVCGCHYVSRPTAPYKVVFFGTDDFAVKSLERLHTEMSVGKYVSDLRVVSVHSHQPHAVVQYANKHCLNVMYWPLKELPKNYDLGVVASFGHLLPKRIINCFPLGIFNIHASLLPRWRGAAPIIHAMLNGDVETGVTMMRIEPHKFDIGNIIAQEKFSVPAHMKSKELTGELSVLGADLLGTCLSDLQKYISNSRPQSNCGVTHAPKVTSATSVITWHAKSSAEIYNQYRALDEVLKLTTMWKGTTVKLSEMITPDIIPSLQLDSLAPSGHPGQMYYHKKRCLLCVRCMDGWVAFRKVQVKGRKPGLASDFHSGFMTKELDLPLYFS